LREKGYDNLEQAIGRYRDEQIGIYEMVIDRGGELRNRALFALGRLYWGEGNYDLALKKWDAIGSGYSSKFYQDVRIIKNTTKDRNELIRKVDGLFDWETYKESSQLLERLLKYHKWKKREKADKAKA
jgi:tetratricopeptide (TPR) repeat protein